MEKLEKRIIEIRDDIQFLDEKMNKTYSDYEVAKDKREDAEVNLEILINQKKIKTNARYFSVIRYLQR